MRDGPVPARHDHRRGVSIPRKPLLSSLNLVGEIFRMLRFARAKPLVGLDIGSSAVKVVELRRFKGGYELSGAGLQPLAAGTVVDGAIADARSLADSIQEIFSRHTIKNKNVATSVAGHAVIVKKISLPAMSREELDESIQWEAEQHVPFDAADVNLDYQVLEGASGSGEAEVLLVAAKKDKILSHTEVIAQAGRSPLVVDVDAFALLNAYQSNYRPASSMTAALLNIGASIMNVVVTRGGSLCSPATCPSEGINSPVSCRKSST